MKGTEMDKNDRCVICGDIFTNEDIRIFCPDCGMPMHKDCFDVRGECPNSANHFRYAAQEQQGEGAPVRMKRHFEDGTGCEICGKPFTEDDEKVYCPDCGTAMHRLCYNMTHKCPYSDEHTPRPYFTGTGGNRTISARPVCDRCGKDLDNGEDKAYCPVCGTPVHRSCWEAEPVCPNADKHGTGYDWEAEHTPPKPKVAVNAQGDDIPLKEMAFDNFSEMIHHHPIRSQDSGEEMTVCGVKQDELVHFLGENNISTPRFFALFLNMANSGKVISLNLSAWFFMPLYHFYRRMTGPAVVLTLMTFVLTVPSLIRQIIFFGTGGGTSELPLLGVANVTSYILIAVRILLLLFNDYLYMRWSVSKILALRERYKDEPPDVYYTALEHSGNPRMMYVLGGISLIFLLVYLLNLFMTVSGFIS